MCKITTFFSNEIIFKVKTTLKLRFKKITLRFMKIFLSLIFTKLSCLISPQTSKKMKSFLTFALQKSSIHYEQLYTLTRSHTVLYPRRCV